MPDPRHTCRYSYELTNSDNLAGKHNFKQTLVYELLANIRAPLSAVCKAHNVRLEETETETRDNTSWQIWKQRKQGKKKKNNN